MNNSNIIDKVISSPDNYAAIYARISGTADNNSISSQIQLATDALNKKNLLVYDIYTDFDSAKKLSPTKRKGLSKLLIDAKAGCFKTVIIYRLDRLVRRYQDWLEIKNTFSKLGITLIYSDETQSFPINSSQGEFFQNLMVMVAEMEPDTISHRASKGREVRRNQGAYSCGKNTPFGYIRQGQNEADSKKISKSIFVGQPIQLSFIKFIFREFNNLIIDEKNSGDNPIKTTISTIYTALENAIEYLEKFIATGKIPLLSLEEDSPLYELYCNINNALNLYPYESVLDNINDVKYHYLLDEKKMTKRNANNIDVCLKNSIYAGYMLVDSSHPFKGLKYSTDDNDNTIYSEDLDDEAFIKANNLNGIIPYPIFRTVYSYLTYESLGRIDKTPNFLFKGALRCSCSKKLKLVDDMYLHCGTPTCTLFLKNDLLSFIASELVKDCLSHSDTTVKNFLKTLNRKAELDTQNINSLKKKKFDAVANYINSKDESYIDYIYSKKTSIDSYLDLCSQYREKASYINSLFNDISTLKDQYEKQNSSTDSTKLSKTVERITDYIITNENKFIPIFSEIIKYVKVNLNDKSNTKKGSLKISYEFATKKNSNIS